MPQAQSTADPFSSPLVGDLSSNNLGATAGNSGGLSSLLSGLSSAAGGITSALASPLGQLGLLGGEYALVANQAKNTQAQNNALAGQISAIGQPDVTAGKNLLDSYTAGKLTAPFQAQLDAEKMASANTATSQTQQVAQLLANSGGGQNVQSAMVGESGQIAAAKNLADTQAMSNAFIQELQSSLNLTSTGGAYVQAGIMQEIQSNTALQQQLSQLMGMLANAYAKSVSGSGGTGAGSGTAGAGGGAGSLWNQVSKLLSGGSGGPNVSQLAQGATAGATAMGAGGLTALASDPTGVDAALAAGANGPLGTGAGWGAAAPELSGYGDLTDASGNIIQSASDINALSGASDLASTGGDLASTFSAGSSAAGATEAGLTAADLAVPNAADLGLSAIGGGTEAAGAASGAAAGGGSSLASIGAIALPVAAALGVGYLAYEGMAKPLKPDVISQVGPGQKVTKLQSGQQALQQGNFAMGAGADRSKGSGQAFIIQANGTPKYLGNQVTSTLQNFVASVPKKNGQPDFSGITYDPKATKDIAITAYGASAGSGAGLLGTSVPKAYGGLTPAQVSQSLSAVYNNAGGQKAWGVPFTQWLSQVYGVHSNITGAYGA